MAEQLTVPQIKAELRGYGLAPGAGRKPELLARLLAARAADAAEDCSAELAVSEGAAATLTT